MAYVETKIEKASEILSGLRASKFKGIAKRPKANTMNACLYSAARLAFENNETYYVLPTFGGITISPRDDAKATYGIGQGLRVTPEGEVFANKLAV